MLHLTRHAALSDHPRLQRASVPQHADAHLLVGYDPATSLAWLGAMPDENQGELFAVPISEADAASDRAFLKAGFTVRPLTGKGSRTQLAAFTAKHHYLTTGGMAGGLTFGLFAPTGALVGIAAFARPTNPDTAAGMLPVPARDEVMGAWSHHADVAESEILDFVRLTVMSSADAGCNLGTGAESFFVRQAMSLFQQRNREKWSAVRRAELGLAPLPNAMAKRPWLKTVRTFSDPHAGHVGTLYMASGMYRVGETRAERVWVGLRSGLVLAGRQRSKLKNPTDAGHLANCLRAAWEGATCVLEGRDASGVIVVTRDLTPVRQMAAFNAVVAKRVLRRLTSDATHLAWSVRYVDGGFRTESRPPKPRFALFLGTAPIARALARRCRYLRPSLLAADADWFAPARRWGRGLGYAWPRQPSDHVLLAGHQS